MLNETPEWQALEAHAAAMKGRHIAGLFAADPKRFENFSLAHDGILLDYSRHLADAETMKLLFALARSNDLEGWRDKMFAGRKINSTENRAVLHTALRAPESSTVTVDDENVMPFVHDTLRRMEQFSDAVRSGTWTGHSGKAIKTVINIGIGGSDLGPRMVCDALKWDRDSDITVRFVSNIDPCDLALALADADPETTLFIIASKTFTTQETLANAQAAKDWLLAALGDETAVAKHFCALSTNEQAVRAFGIDPANMFPFKDWVGGRYSLWSAIGLPICIANGFARFRRLLDGAQAMDRHFQDEPLDRNMPVILALLGLWCRNFMGADALAVLPYAQDLKLFVSWLQQLDMESNGKSVDRDGAPVSYGTGPVIFGQPGTNGQHAFHQQLHQGPAMIPCEFIGVLHSRKPQDNHHDILLAHMAAQSQALMQGRGLEQSGDNPHRVCPGNRPSATILLDRLDAYHLGQLLALYEHKVFVQGIIWGINSFDQWGVELGKALASDILLNAKNSAVHSLTGYIRENS